MKGIKITELSIDELSFLLSKCSKRKITSDDIKKIIMNTEFQNKSAISLIDYTALLIKKNAKL